MVDCNVEAARAETLAVYGLMDTPREPVFDAIVAQLAEATGMPMATISLVDTERQWFKASIGMDGDGTPIAESICAVAVRSGDATFVVTDAAADARFRDYPCVTGAPHIRFYAGTPLKLRNGVRVGTLCVIDAAPRDGFAPEDQALLETLARRTVAAFELRHELKGRGLAASADAPWVDEALAGLDRAAAALDQIGATVALAHLDEVIAQVQALRP